MGWVVATVVFATILYGLHRIASWAEDRGWIYYRAKDRPAPPLLGMFEEIYHPAIEHVVVETSDEAIRADHAGSGRDPGDPESLGGEVEGR